MQDITERKSAEDELRRVNAELARSNAELEQFAYVASHDLQEPLRMVASFTQLLAKRYRDRLDEDAQEFIGFAVDGAQRMQRLLNDLLQYSRVQRTAPRHEPVDSRAAVDAVLADLRPQIEEAGAQITLGQLPAVIGDETMLRLVFQNLISNGLKFRSPERPLILRVVAERSEEGWRFSVEDNGIGIPVAYRERVFGMFQRLHARDEYPGTGMGLAIVKRCLGPLGGRVWVDDTTGGGATFRFLVLDADDKST
jgi:light-regulated signal transduction histidine kinase (bacteriophytochrome)